MGIKLDLSERKKVLERNQQGAGGSLTLCHHPDLFLQSHCVRSLPPSSLSLSALRAPFQHDRVMAHLPEKETLQRDRRKRGSRTLQTGRVVCSQHASPSCPGGAEEAWKASRPPMRPRPVGLELRPGPLPSPRLGSLAARPRFHLSFI